MGVMRDFLDYISAPYFSEGKDPFTVKTLPILGKLLAFEFLFVLVAYILLSYVIGLTGADKPAQRSEVMQNFTPLKFVLIVVIAPLLEELFFRSWLRKRWGVKYIFPVITLLSAWKLIRFFQIPIPKILILLTSAGLILYFIWAKQISSDEDNTYYIDRLFPYAFWISTLAFALIHLTNYKVEQIGVLGVLVVLPQFISGTFLGYITKRFGYWASVCAHGFWNGALVTTALVLTNFIAPL